MRPAVAILCKESGPTSATSAGLSMTGELAAYGSSLATSVIRLNNSGTL